MKTAAAKPQGMLATDIKISGSTYAHSLATKALGEVYLLAKAGQKMPPRLEATFRKAVDLIIKSQNPRASWCYGGEMAGQPAAYNPTSEGEDLPLANCQIQALVTAKEADLSMPGIDACMKKPTTSWSPSSRRMVGLEIPPQIITITNGTCQGVLSSICKCSAVYRRRAKEAIAGYFLLAVDSTDEAVRIAQACPIHAYGAQIEVRPVADLCRPMADVKAAQS